MAKRNPVPLNTGVGRFIGGSLYEGKSVNDEGQPLTFSSGSQQGQPRTEYSFGIAIAKTKGHWAEEPFGAPIWAEGHAAWPGGQAQRPDFSWKVQDGDSAIPNKAGKRNCDKAGYPGHWILWFTSPSSPPPVAVAISGPPQWNTTPGFCNPGDYIEVTGSVVSNESTKTAGVYLNVAAVCMRAYGERIASVSVDLATAGFGAAPLPAGASLTPVGNVMAPAAPPAPGASPSTPAAPPTPAAPASAPAAPPAPTTTPVTPDPAILGAPAPVTVPPAPVPSPVTPPPAARVLKNGGVYDDWIKAGWTDESLRAAGHLD